MNRLHPAALAIVFVALLAGCGQKKPQEPYCKNPSTQEEKQMYTHKESTESRIAPTERPKNWLEVKP